MSWTQWGLLAALVVAGFEVTYQRLKRLLQVKGHHEQALDALAGRVQGHGETLRHHGDRIERVERELRLR